MLGAEMLKLNLDKTASVIIDKRKPHNNLCCWLHCQLHHQALHCLLMVDVSKYSPCSADRWRG